MDYPYTAPDFLQNQTTDEIHRRMLDALPTAFDKSENQIPWDLTRPAALEKAEFVEFELNETVKIMFPHWAYGQWLDLHAELMGVTRRPANCATGTLQVTAVEGTEIPAGFQFATPAYLTASVLFETAEPFVFSGTPDDKGQITADVSVVAVVGGQGGNVKQDTIKLMVKPLAGIVLVRNQEETTGGTEEEDDDTLRERVLAAIRSGISYVGCDADYVRWAQEIAAVGHVIVDPEWDGPGTVRVLVVDANGTPANEQILAAVYAHIVSPDDRMNRLAPIGATVTVSAPTEQPINLYAEVALEPGAELETVTALLEAALGDYWLQAAEELAVKYVFVGGILANIPGVANYEYDSLLINGGKDDILLTVAEFPTTGEVTLRA